MTAAIAPLGDGPILLFFWGKTPKKSGRKDQKPKTCPRRKAKKKNGKQPEKNTRAPFPRRLSGGASLSPPLSSARRNIPSPPLSPTQTHPPLGYTPTGRAHFLITLTTVPKVRVP
jgi:hypothetical protein